MRRKRGKGGFTLLELVVVMGIAAAVAAITIPLVRSISNSNRGMSCASRMQRIGQAIKMYALDEVGVPPYYPQLVNGNLVMEEDLVPPPPRWGLQKLVDTGYLKSDHALHCPADREHGLGTALYAHSYDSVDRDARSSATVWSAEVNKHAYLSCRGVRQGTGDQDLKRQLSPLPADPNSFVPVVAREWHPDDTSVVTWCRHHYFSIRENGVGQYQVLFWDGHVRRMGGNLLRSGSTDAWRVDPTADVTP